MTSAINIFLFYSVHNPELRWMKTSSRDIPSITRVTVTSEDMLTCNQCSKVFTSLDELTTHENTHVEEKQQQEQELLHEQQKQTVDMLTCGQCNKNFTSKSELTAHIGNNCLDVAVVAMDTSTVDRLCPFCGKRFRSMATLENHKRVHTREKPFTCEVCTKPFRTKGNLLEHMRVHNTNLWLMKSDTKLQTTDTATATIGGGSGEHNYKCTLCIKSFRTYTALLNHERVHTREKPFECSVCDKCFRTKSNLTEHMKGCHDMDSSASNEVQVFTFKTQVVTSSYNSEA